MVSAAARRASANAAAPSKRPRRLSYYSDIIAVGLASIVAGTALKNRRDHDEQVAFLEAELARAHADRDRATHTVDTIKQTVGQRAPDAVKALDEVTERKQGNQDTERAAALQNWLDDAFDRALNEIEADRDQRRKVTPDEKPEMI